MVLAVSNGASPTPPYSGYKLIGLCFIYGTITLSGRVFQLASIHAPYYMLVLQPLSCRNKIGLGYSAFARHY